MRLLFNNVFSSLAARVIIVVVGLQLCLALLFTVYQGYAAKKYYEGEGFHEFALTDASDILTALNKEKPSKSNKVAWNTYSRQEELWDDLLRRNPSFNYLRVGDNKIYQHGELSEYAKAFEREFRAGSVPKKGCRTLYYSTDEIYTNYIQCEDGEISSSTFEGLDANFIPTNNSYVLEYRPAFIPRSILWSYVLILIVTPFLIMFFIRPLRKAAKAARNISSYSRGYQIPTHGMYSEARGFVDAINVALVKLDLGHQRESHLRNAIAHELKTPLTVLRARLDDVKDSNLRKKLIDDIRKMNHLIERLLAFAKASSEPMPLSLINLVDSVKEACAHCGASAIAAGIDIKYQSEEEIVLVHSSRTAIFIAVTNIINNSIQHSQSSEPIEVRVTKMGEVIIKDKGCGFAQLNDKKHFETLDDFSNRSIKNHGLGISIAMQVIQLSEGSIEYHSAVNKGTNFKIKFPI